MKTGINRSTAFGATAALFVGLLAAVPTAGAATAVGPVVLTAAQAREVLRTTVRETEEIALRDGLRLETTTGYVKGDPSGWRDVLTIDPARGTARFVDDARGWTPPYKSESPNPCIPNGSVDRHGRWIWKAGVGRWTRLGLDKDNYERAGAKLAGSPRTRWSERSLPKTTLKKVLVSYGLRERLGRDSDVAGLTTGGTASATATGTRYLIAFRERGASSDTGTLTLDVRRGGALRSARLLYAADEDGPAFSVSYTASYGKQKVLVPRVRIVKSPALVSGCRAAFARAYPQKLAGVTALLVNFLDPDEDDSGQVLKDIRVAARVLNVSAEYGVSVKVRKIKYGVQIVGRHRLLGHPYVSTVFVRNGKAVAHKVR